MKYASNAVISIFIAFFLNFIIALIVSSTKKAEAKELISKSSVEFQVSNVVGTKTGEKKVYSPQSDSSGSGSSGGSGGGGGGGSSGGGGGHSF